MGLPNDWPAHMKGQGGKGGGGHNAKIDPIQVWKLMLMVIGEWVARRRRWSLWGSFWSNNNAINETNLLKDQNVFKILLTTYEL